MRGVLVAVIALIGCARSAGNDPAAPPPARSTAAPKPTLEPRPHDSTSRAVVPSSQEPVAPPDPLAAEAAKVVDRQNEAYNRHDIEAFLATYADSVAVQTLGDTVPVLGKARLRESTAAWFAEAPATQTEVVERMVLGPFVVDRQRVTGAGSAHPLDAIGIYEVREGLIRRVWSIPPPPTPH